MCHGQNRQFQHGWNVSWSKSSISAWLECVLVKIVSFSMFEIPHGQNRQFQHGCVIVKIVSSSMSVICHDQNCPFQYGWNVSWSKSLASAFLEYVIIKIVSSSMSGICPDQNCSFQHGWNLSWSKSSILAWPSADCKAVRQKPWNPFLTPLPSSPRTLLKSDTKMPPMTHLRTNEPNAFATATHVL
jgi:hypothetical protein